MIAKTSEQIPKASEIMRFLGEIKTERKVNAKKRLATGVPGVDELMSGGIPENSLVLLSGPCGSGKTIFSFRYLVEGAMNNEPGVYVSMEEDPEQIINEMESFGWPVSKLIKEKKLLIVRPELYKYDALLTAIEDAVRKIGAKRLVIDSMTIIEMYFEEPFKVRRAIFDLDRMLKRIRCTTLAITEAKETREELTTYGVGEYIADGVIILYYIKKENMFLRALTIRKMRFTEHSNKIHPIRIDSDNGVIVYGTEELFADV